MERARAAVRRLAERHATGPTAPDAAVTLVNHAESPRADDWTLRSALVRLASPEPQLVADLLTRVRRLDAQVHALRDEHAPDGVESTGAAPWTGPSAEQGGAE